MPNYPVPVLGGDDKIPVKFIPDGIGSNAIIDPENPDAVLIEEGTGFNYGKDVLSKVPDNGAIAVGKGELVVRVADFFASDRVVGTTDDVPAYQAAYNALSSRGGTILVDTSTYVGSDLNFLFTQTKPIRLISGADRQGAIVVLSSVSIASPLATLLGHVKPSPWNAGVRHEISGLRIDGNYRVVRVISLVNAHAMTVRDNHILYPSAATVGASCLYINADGEGISWENKIYRNRMEAGSGDTVENWSEYCMDIRSSDNHINENVVLRARTALIYNTGGDNVYIQNHGFYGPYHFVSAGNFGATWIGNISDGPGIVGFRVYANDTIMKGNRTFWPANVPSTFVAGIEVVWSISNSIIQGNIVHAESDTSGLLTTDNRIVVRLSPASTTIIKDNPGASIATGLGLASVGKIQMTYADGTPVGGNGRGGGSVDLQFTRTSANQVTSGASSFAVGARNLVSGNTSAAIGQLHNVTGNSSIATGKYASDHQIDAARVHAAGRFSANGDQQIADYILAATTSSVTKTYLTIDQQTISAQSTVSFGTTAITAKYTIDLVGLDKTTAGNIVAFRTTVLLTKDNTTAGTSLIGTPTWVTEQSIGTGSTAVPEATASTARGGLLVAITAPNTNTWRWTAHVRGIEMS